MKRNRLDMGNHGECSVPKKSKSSTQNNIVNSQWAFLPSVLIHQIFDMLNPEDRKHASTVCRHWRKSFFHPKWWPSMKFKIEPDNIPKAKFYSSTFGHNVSEAIISLNSLSSSCIYEFILLLRLLNENNHLKSLIIEPSHCRLEEPLSSLINPGGESDITEILDLIIAILPRLTQFSLGGLEDLARYNDYIIRNLSASKVTLLGLASVKDDTMLYEESYFEPDLISSFKNLQILSIDYDQLSDKFLYNLEEVRNLQRLVVHLHAVPKSHPGTSNMAWKDFKNAHPNCLLRLTVIHAYSAIRSLHARVLRDEMPLSHIKVFFCEDVNMEVLHNLSTFYARTLRSVMWIDSLNHFLPCRWKFTKPAESPDPFVLMSWLCLQFEELVLCGYKYSEENLVAISRLRGSKMKKLEIPATDVLYAEFEYKDAVKEIAKNLEGAWNQMHIGDLHPVIVDPNAGDSDEFLLPLVLADLH